MKKFNRKFNKAYSRLVFWNALGHHFIDFRNLLQSNDNLTSEDKLTLFKIHTLLSKCYQLVRERKSVHSNKISALIEG